MSYCGPSDRRGINARRRGNRRSGNELFLDRHGYDGARVGIGVIRSVAVRDDLEVVLSRAVETVDRSACPRNIADKRPDRFARRLIVNRVAQRVFGGVPVNRRRIDARRHGNRRSRRNFSRLRNVDDELVSAEIDARTENAPNARKVGRHAERYEVGIARVDRDAVVREGIVADRRVAEERLRGIVNIRADLLLPTGEGRENVEAVRDGVRAVQIDVDGVGRDDRIVGVQNRGGVELDAASVVVGDRAVEELGESVELHARAARRSVVDDERVDRGQRAVRRYVNAGVRIALDDGVRHSDDALIDIKGAALRVVVFKDAVGEGGRTVRLEGDGAEADVADEGRRSRRERRARLDGDRAAVGFAAVRVVDAEDAVFNGKITAVPDRAAARRRIPLRELDPLDQQRLARDKVQNADGVFAADLQSGGLRVIVVKVRRVDRERLVDVELTAARIEFDRLALEVGNKRDRVADDGVFGNRLAQRNQIVVSVDDV